MKTYHNKDSVRTLGRRVPETVTDCRLRLQAVEKGAREAVKVCYTWLPTWNFFELKRFQNILRSRLPPCRQFIFYLISLDYPANSPAPSPRD